VVFSYITSMSELNFLAILRNLHKFLTSSAAVYGHWSDFGTVVNIIDIDRFFLEATVYVHGSLEDGRCKELQSLYKSCFGMIGLSYRKVRQYDVVMYQFQHPLFVRQYPGLLDLLPNVAVVDKQLAVSVKTEEVVYTDTDLTVVETEWKTHPPTSCRVCGRVPKMGWCCKILSVCNYNLCYIFCCNAQTAFECVVPEQFGESQIYHCR
jgi:hypothetical protein